MAFSGQFFQASWDIIAQDLLAAVREFFSGVPIPRSVSSALMVLIPKKDSPTTFNYFRPLCLCHFLNKIFTRILCDRLKSLLPKLIEEEQSAFLQGRDIVDNVLLAQEMVQHLDKRVRGHNIMFKLDMMKAFDRVSWDFLQRCLLKFGFHPLFVQLIMNNLSASWFSILINGSQSGFFKSSRGVKQGDPLSPYLFLLVVEALSRGLKALQQGGSTASFSLPRGARRVSHLCFADDLVIFTRANRPRLFWFFGAI